jgi:hypothetical protein|tara:strand:+ start:2363 stop:2761 length:399 start_codon:yes stop_codon:yes gene_type:complete
MGRPKKTVDPEQVKELARLGCTWDEIASVLDVARGTFSARMKEKKYRDAYDRGIAEGNTSLRRAQFDAAVGGNSTMLIWVGKNRLNQTDRVETQNETIIHDDSHAIDKLVGAVDRLASRSGPDGSTSSTKSG